jgi:nitrate/nitrite transport system permease protein
MQGTIVSRKPFAPSISIAARRALVQLRNAVLGFGLVLTLWYGLSHAFAPQLPDPVRTFGVFRELVTHPFYDAGPNDKGIGLQLLASLGRVFLGFSIGVALALPLGILMGASESVRGLLNPVVQILRPVSPMAWFPVGLAAFHSSSWASVFVIAVTSLWPTLINTTLGVGSVPLEYRHVAQVYGFSRWTYLTKVLLPHSLPYIVTGFRVGLGVAWMVIVASEMLAGGTGIGFFLWDSWNALSLEQVFSAILLIGCVGWAMDTALGVWVRRLGR